MSLDARLQSVAAATPAEPPPLPPAAAATIFEPLRFRNLEVKNRIFRSSVPGRFDNYDGWGTEVRINWDLKFARGGVGGIISSNAPVDARGHIVPGYAYIDSDATPEARQARPRVRLQVHPPDRLRRARADDQGGNWTTKTSRAYFDAVKAAMQDLAGALGARFNDSPLWYFRRVVTAHPLGGCPMARTPEQGVVDAHGQVFGVPGLSIADGSVMPGPVGPNPSLTIAALADRFADRILEQDEK